MCSASRAESRFKRARSVRLVLALWYVGTLIAIALLTEAILYDRLRSDLNSQYEHFLTTYSEDLNANLVEHPLRSAEALEALVNEVAYFRSAAIEYRVFDEKGRSFFTTARWKDYPAPDGVEENRTIQMAGEPFRMRTTSVEIAPGLSWLTQTGISLRFLESTLANYERDFALVAFPLIALSFLGGLWLARKALRPVVKMADTARRITSENLTQRLEVRGTGDDLDRLASSINAMLDRLEESFDRIERFSVDLAHELRTPITRLIGETERALISTPGEEDLRDLLAEHAGTYESMNYMINDVLRLLRTGVTGQSGKPESVKLAELFESTVESFSALAEERGIELQYRLSAPQTRALCRPAHIRRLVSNLLDNAIRHTEREGKVELAVSANASTFDVTVRDSGEGIPETDLPRIFERFFRSEKARSGNGTGFGLGLSIVKHVVDEHGGTISVESEEKVGTTVRITLPLVAHD